MSNTLICLRLSARFAKNFLHVAIQKRRKCQAVLLCKSSIFIHCIDPLKTIDLSLSSSPWSPSSITMMRIFAADFMSRVFSNWPSTTCMGCWLLLLWWCCKWRCFHPPWHLAATGFQWIGWVKTQLCVGGCAKYTWFVYISMCLCENNFNRS